MGPKTRVHIRRLVYAHEMDGAAQRLKGLKTNADAGRLPNGATTLHFQLQSGVFHVIEHLGGEEPIRFPQRCPWLCRAVITLEQTTDFQLEALLRRLPFLLEDPAAMRRIASRFYTFVISMTMGRAVTNALMLKWMASWLKHNLPGQITLLAESCNGHGAALVKSQSSGSKRVQATLNSFPRLTRDFAA